MVHAVILQSNGSMIWNTVAVLGSGTVAAREMTTDLKTKRTANKRVSNRLENVNSG